MTQSRAPEPWTPTPEAIRALRERLGLTQARLAELVDAASPVIVSRWENGHSKPMRVFALKLAALHRGELKP